MKFIDEEERVFALNQYLSAGYVVRPIYPMIGEICGCSKDDCCSPGKHPMRKGRGSNDANQITKWLHEFPCCNWAITTGPASNIFVVDVDGAEGQTTWGKWQEAYGEIDTATVATGRGYHYYFKYPKSVTIGSRVAVALGIDIRGDNSYVIAPPSIHMSGRSYRWLDSEVQIAEAPEWLIQLITCKNQPSSSLESATDFLAATPIVEGTRNTTLFKAGCAMRGQGMEKEEIGRSLTRVNEQQCVEPLSASEVEVIAGSCASYRKGGGASAIQSGFSPSNPLFFMPVNPKELLAAEDFLYMDCAQRGRYYTLVFSAWSNGGFLPNNLYQLYKLSRATCSYEEFVETAEPVLAPFVFEEVSGLLVHQGVRDLFLKQWDKYRQKVEAGRTGGKAAQLKKSSTELSSEVA